MHLEEMKSVEIDNYCRLQMIKKNNGNQENPTLDYEIKISAAKLETYGVNIENLTIN